MVIWIFLFVSSICASATSNGNVVWLKSPRVTSWGQFDQHEYCPKNSFVTGMRLKVDHYHDGDNTALNGIQLVCTDMNGHDSTINSVLGRYGSFGKIKHCHNGFATGFRLRSQSSQGFLKDDVGAVDFKLICSGINGNRSQVISDDNGFLPWGSWTKDQHCPRKSVVCGIATQVDKSYGFLFKRDQTTLNNVDVACCPLQRPFESCHSLTSNWQTFIGCSGGAACDIKLMTGIIGSKQLSKFRKFYDNQRNKIGSFDKFAMKHLEVNAKLHSEKINNKSLQRILKHTNVDKNESAVAVNCKGKTEQLVVTCNFIKLYTSESRCVPDRLADKESKVQGLYFQPTSRSENIFWSYNCDFTGTVVGSVSTGIAADCGEMCLSNVDCTHFMWNDHNNAGTCWMKNVSTLYTPVEKYGENIHCGWVERPSKE